MLKLTIIHLWLIPAIFEFGSCFRGAPETLRNRALQAAFSLAWPVSFPAMWLLNRWAR